MKTFVLLLSMFFISLNSFSQKRIHDEYAYKNKFVAMYDGETDVKINSTKFDIVTKDYVINVGYIDKWSPTINIASVYNVDNKKVAVLLIFENPIYEDKYMNNVLLRAKRYGITVYGIDSGYKIRKLN